MSFEFDDGEYGPAMLALNERRRKFVTILVNQGHHRPVHAMKQAGFVASNFNVQRQTAFKLMHSPAVQAAIQEETAKRVKLGGMVGVTGLYAIAANPKHKDHFRALESLADRAGYVSEQNINVKHEHTDRTGAALIERIRELAKKHGMDPEKLLGGQVIENKGPPRETMNQPLVIEGKAEEVK